MYINMALLFGNLTRDPELRALPSGVNVCNFSVATNRVFKDRDGKEQEQTDFHNIIVFGRQADSVSKFLKKGSSVFVEGRMQTRSWEKDGKKMYRTEVIADRVQFGPRSGKSDAEQTSDPERNTGTDDVKDEINPDDIPF